MRATRLIYVENDPALLGIMGSLLAESPEIDVVLATESPAEAIAFESIEFADVALLDLALGAGEMNGVGGPLSRNRARSISTNSWSC